MTDPMGPPPEEVEPAAPPPWYRQPAVLVAVVVAVVVVLLLIVFALAEDDEADVAVGPTPTPTPTVTIPATPSPEVTVPGEEPTVPPDDGADPDDPAGDPATGVDRADDVDPIELSGTGSATTVDFELDGGLLVVDAAHDGDAPFNVTVLADDGTAEEIVRAEGRYQGSRALGLAAGTYRFEVGADGAWRLAVTQPRYTGAPALPSTYEGRGDVATEPFESPGGDLRLEWEIDEGADVEIRVLHAAGDEAGEEVARHTAEGGAGDATVPDLEPGLYLLDVQAGGDTIWRLRLS